MKRFLMLVGTGVYFMIVKMITIQTATLTAKLTLGIHVLGDTAMFLAPNSAVWQTGKSR